MNESSPELLAQFVASEHPGATVKAVGTVAEITIPGEMGLTAIVTCDGVEIRLPTLWWPLPYDPVPGTRFYRRFAMTPLVYGEATTKPVAALSKIVKRGLAARRREFHVCRYCGEKVPPEHRHSKDVCHGCASSHLGVVY